MKNPWIIIGVLVVALFGGAVWYSSVIGERANEGVEISSNVKGNPDADVVLVEYSDFQCPACGSFYPIVKEIVADHSDAVRFEYRHFPLMRVHPLAEPAARAAEAAGQQGKFWEYHDALFENQDVWAGQGGGGAAYFATIAEELELDMQQFARHQRSSLIREKIQSDISDGLSRGVNSTPTFFLNGQRVELQTVDDLRAAVEDALGVTAEATATGTEAAGTSSAPTTQAPGTPPVQFGF